MSSELAASIEHGLGPDVIAAMATIRRGAAEKGLAHVEVHLASLPRRAGRDYADSRFEITPPEGTIDVRAWRRCDLAAVLILDELAIDAEALVRLYFQGDAEERRMILRALPFRPVDAATVRLLVEAHRTNDEAIFMAGFADSDLPARALDDEDYDRGVLKAAFIDLPLPRLHRCVDRASARLTSMLLDFMTEREAAMRPVWHGSLELGAHAPAPGLVPRVAGDLWHGVDARRLDAARASRVLDDESVKTSARERAAVEPVAEIREILTRL